MYIHVYIVSISLSGKKGRPSLSVNTEDGKGAKPPAEFM